MAIYINNNGTAKRMDGAGDGSLYAPVTSVATPENGDTASKAYAVGEMFIRDGKLCTCLVAIAQGGTFVKNTNYKEGDVGSVLTELNSKITANTFGTVVDLTPYARPSYLTIPNDGYVALSSVNSGDDNIVVGISDLNSVIKIYIGARYGSVSSNSLFVKKGFKVWVHQISGSPAVQYVPLS